MHTRKYTEEDAHNFEELCSTKAKVSIEPILFPQSLGILRVWGLLRDGHGEGRRGGRHSAPAHRQGEVISVSSKPWMEKALLGPSSFESS